MVLRLRSLALSALAAGLAFAQPMKNPPRVPPLVRPDAFSVVERFEHMSPEQRQRFLDRLPPERRKQFEDRLRRYDRMTPEQRRQVREQYELFQGLSREQQESLRESFRRFSQSPPERRHLLRLEYQRLRELPAADRRARLESDDFRSRYSPAEQQLLGDMARLLPPRPRASAPDAPAK